MIHCFQSILILCIDEIHERNADMDLLLALAKKAMRTRLNHPTLAPLQLVLMSATLDVERWEDYFRADDLNTTISIVDVPDAHRFPVDVIHLGERQFPVHDRNGGIPIIGPEIFLPSFNIQRGRH